MVSDSKVYGFFHPYCNAGGGGERVLWQAANDTLNKKSTNRIVVYTGDVDSDDEIFKNVEKRFDIHLDKQRVQFVRLSTRWAVDPNQWPVLTLLGQALGSVVLCAEAIYRYKPDYWIDTMGYPFTYFLVKLWLGIPLIVYVHFPVISEDMLGKLHPALSSLGGIKQLLKYIYWSTFMAVYQTAGRFVDIALANSTWTRNHIQRIWSFKPSVSILYPPCSTEKFISQEDLQLTTWNRENSIICLAQFRPEKRHQLIIREYAKFLRSTDLKSAPKLILMGSIRGKSDEDYVQSLKLLAAELKVPDTHVEFILDAKYQVVQEYLRKVTFGLNAMWNEHFGIAVVEYVASGLVPIVHASAGPFLDIVVPWDSESHSQSDVSDETTRTGFFFKSETDPDAKPTDMKFPRLHEAFQAASTLTDEEKLSMTKRGKQSVLNKFSDVKFDQGWDSVLERIDMMQVTGSAFPRALLILLSMFVVILGVTLFKSV